MRRLIGSLWIGGFFGLLAAANAQTPSPSTAGAAFDGTYRFVSSAKVSPTYVTRGGNLGQCPDRKAGTLTIVKGEARYTTATGRHLKGTVGPQGELAMQLLATPDSNGYRPIELDVSGTIGGAGTARARQKSNSCSYDFVWQK
jgi:hypothetical protein